MNWLLEFYIHHNHIVEAHLFLVIVLFIVFSVACNKQRGGRGEGGEEKDATKIIIFIWGMSPWEKIFVFSVQMSSSIVCSIDVQTVWLILFCIVVITNRGLSCTVYLLTGQSQVIRVCKENDIESVGREKSEHFRCWVLVSTELWKLREMFSRRNWWLCLKCICVRATFDTMYKIKHKHRKIWIHKSKN